MSQKKFINVLYKSHSSKVNLPSPPLVNEFNDSLLSILFPAYSDLTFNNEHDLAIEFKRNQELLLRILLYIEGRLKINSEKILKKFYDELPNIYNALQLDAEAIEKGDPAAVSRDEVIRSYPGFYAIAVYRIAHALHNFKVPLIPRMLTEIAHSKTGIDIHPAAKIGAYFFIDHGTGIVIGETTVIGKNVKLYQGVTLGALSVDKKMATTKRHPTLKDNVVIYAGATILGGKTIVGENSVIGGNVWLTKSVPANSTIYHKAQLSVK
jgi:serine O-acetyltransferase